MSATALSWFASDTAHFCVHSYNIFGGASAHLYGKIFTISIEWGENKFKWWNCNSCAPNVDRYFKTFCKITNLVIYCPDIAKSKFFLCTIYFCHSQGCQTFCYWGSQFLVIPYKFDNNWSRLCIILILSTNSMTHVNISFINWHLYFLFIFTKVMSSVFLFMFSLIPRKRKLLLLLYWSCLCTQASISSSFPCEEETLLLIKSLINFSFSNQSFSNLPSFSEGNLTTSLRSVMHFLPLIRLALVGGARLWIPFTL